MDRAIRDQEILLSTLQSSSRRLLPRNETTNETQNEINLEGEINEIDLQDLQIEPIE